MRYFLTAILLPTLTLLLQITFQFLHHCLTHHPASEGQAPTPTPGRELPDPQGPQGTGYTTNSPYPTLFLTNLVHCALAAAALQTAVALPSVLLLRSELLYDASGAASFVAVVLLSLLHDPGRGLLGGVGVEGVWRGVRTAAAGVGRGVVVMGVWDGDGKGALGVLREVVERVGVWEVDWRQGVVSGAVVVWAVRLGAYTFIRGLLNGGDSRFNGIRNKRALFFLVFAGQWGWVMICSLPVIALNSVPAYVFPLIGYRPWNHDFVVQTLWFALGMWSFVRGFAIECIADWQLSKWRWDKRRKRHDEVFCGRGMWGLSRHPNYYGECLIWLGIAMACSATLLSETARQALHLGLVTVLVLCGTTPWFVYKLLRHTSIPIIENKYDKLYMHRRDYRLWRRSKTFRIWL